MGVTGIPAIKGTSRGGRRLPGDPRHGPRAFGHENEAWLVDPLLASPEFVPPLFLVAEAEE